jgi:hypothetical protein
MYCELYFEMLLYVLKIKNMSNPQLLGSGRWQETFLIKELIKDE